MKNTFCKLVLTSLLLVSFVGQVSARECTECKKVKTQNAAVQAKAAACKRAQSTAELNINNVRALINGYGNMWYDGQIAQYHLPKNQNTCPLYCAALWIGGTDVNQQLRLAALRFGSEGDDYWPGPLKINGTAAVDLPVCNAYDKHYIITKSEVAAFMSHFDYYTDPITGARSVSMKSDPGEDLTEVILNWPAAGVGDDLTSYLAPFYDADEDGVYNPRNGDYPWYDFDNELCPRTIKQKHPEDRVVSLPTMEDQAGIVHGGILSDQVLKGDQTIWWVFNDMGNTHTESDGQPIGLEIRAQAFAFSTNDAINDMTFYSYEIINRSTYELRETYFSQWVDPDLGYGYDDFVGCDVRRGLGYCYNGDENDGPGSGSYSGVPPAVGIDFFQGPYMDPDGKDNPKINIEWIEQFGSAPLKTLLNTYKKNGVYDTADISYHADDFFEASTDGWQSWYFKAGDAVGNCAINGVNFGNTIVDDERFGMRRFVYYNNSLSGINSEPTKAQDYYNYLRGYWKNGARMTFGADGTTSTSNGGVPCDFMYPDNTDPWHWGTDGEKDKLGEHANDWKETNGGSGGSKNTPGDRRFMQSAGPFTLKPGALNYITVGIPFARGTSNALSSVTALRQIDDICQKLFENCFKVLDGPDAPTVTVQELNNEVVLYLSYENPSSNNYGERYAESSPSIPSSYQDTNGNSIMYSQMAREYRFEGYQIYQLKDASVSISEIDDPTKALLVAQCDLENYYDSLIISYNTETKQNDTSVNPNPSLAIGTLVNFTQNGTILEGKVMVEGANKGIQHVFRITSDAFASGVNTKLVNNKEYYFVAIAYAHNRYKEYSQTDAAYLDGQKEPYLAGRKSETQGSITPVVAIPHDPTFENGGQQAQAEFGMSPNIIRLGGYGNGGSMLRLSQQSIDSLMGLPGQFGKGPGLFVANVSSSNDKSNMQNPCIINNPVYEEDYGPINVRVIDPLKIHEGRFNLMFYNKDNSLTIDENTRWYVVRDGGGHIDSIATENGWRYRDTIYSDFTIGRSNEQLFLELGLAVTLVNSKPVASPVYVSDGISYICGGTANRGALIASSMNTADENSQWLSGIPDNDSYFVYNWVHSGAQYSLGASQNFTSQITKYSPTESYLDEDIYKFSYIDRGMGQERVEEAVDKNQDFEGVVYGMWAPYAVTSTSPFHPGFNYSYYLTDMNTFDSLRAVETITPTTYKTWYHLERQVLANSANFALNFCDMSTLPSIRVVFTADTTKWTRCPVIEMCDDNTQSEGNARRFSARKHLSVDRQGRTITDRGISADPDDPTNPAYISAEGMGWFPGYAINTATGERLNIMFGEDSRYVQHHGNDMLWNPDHTITEGTQNYIMGGRHYVYVMNATTQPFYNMRANDVNTLSYYRTPSYDAGRWAIKMLSSAERMMKTIHRGSEQQLYNGITAPATSSLPQRDSIALLYASTAWVSMPLVNERFQFDNPLDIPCDVTIDIDVRNPYGSYLSSNNTTSDSASFSPANRELPAYQFVLNASDAVLTGLATRDNADQDYKDELLKRINVVPNPYYSYSNYETASQLETKVRIVNLPTGEENGQPKGCVIKIYTVDGTLVRTLGPTPVTRNTNSTSDNPYAESTSVDWDLHNQTGIPIAGGMYLIHVSVPGIGERVIKWFGTMRPVDLNSFQF